MLQGPSEETKREPQVAGGPAEGGTILGERARLEAEVMEFLIARRTERTLEFMVTAEFQSGVGEMATKMVSAMADAMPDLDREEFGAARELMIGEIESALSDPGKMREVAASSARRYYGGAADVENEIDSLRNVLVEQGIEAPELMRAMCEMSENVHAESEPNRRIVEHLLGIAESRGIGEASTAAAYAEAVKSVFPTVAEFEAHFMGGKDRLGPSVERVNAALEKELPEAGPVIAAMMRSYMGEGPLSAIRSNFVAAEAAQIYGS